ncbi:MAG: hypothetical protein D8M22_09385 [Armatimonadetes bacterium]|nr:hypothetical protein [Armatimonadota bacterium]
MNQESETGAFPVGVSPAIPTTGFGVSALQAQEIWPDGTGTRSSAFAIGLRPFRPTGSIWWRGYQVFDLRYRLAAFQAWGIWPGQVVRCSESFGPTGLLDRSGGTGTRPSAFAIGLRPFRPRESGLASCPVLGESRPYRPRNLVGRHGYQVFDLRYRLAAFQAWGIWPGQVVRCSESFGPTGPGNLAGWHEFQAFGLRFRLAVFQA